MKSSNLSFSQAIRRYALSTPVLCSLALACWTASLFLTALGSSSEHAFRGLDLLALGWLALLSINFAWLANAWFLLALLRLFNRRKSDGLALLALVCALDTVRMTQYPQNEGGNYTQIYGYGWGAVLWVLAMTLLVTASGSLPGSSPLDATRSPPRTTWLKPVGLALCMTWIIVVSVLVIGQNGSANTFEKTQLNRYAFKRTAVCGVEVAAVREPLADFSGPLALNFKTATSSGPQPFNNIETLLRWGIPSVRSDGKDFRLVNMGQEQMLTSSASSSEAAATLTINEGRTQMKATLIAPDGREVFEQIWNNGAGGKKCPEYSESPTAGMQPRKLLTEALGALPVATPKNSRLNSSTRGTVVERKEFTNKAAVGPNNGCPADTGWFASQLPKATSQYYLPQPFQIAERLYYPDGSTGRRAFCAGSSVYFYGIHPVDRGLTIQLQRREVADFRLAWITYIKIDPVVLGNDESNLQIDNITERSEDITVSITRLPRGPTVLINAKVFPAP
ncbi:hypothetical protein [Pseudomonas syringae]|uniref:hypothetical protein n=1 Tax=Pseudomonas syringae TaxID=317 RepID=UPI001372E85A|nr:hypothetical protein [Pseudomonas syringae]